MSNVSRTLICYFFIAISFRKFKWASFIFSKIFHRLSKRLLQFINWGVVDRIFPASSSDLRCQGGGRKAFPLRRHLSVCSRPKNVPEDCSFQKVTQHFYWRSKRRQQPMSQKSTKKHQAKKSGKSPPKVSQVEHKSLLHRLQSLRYLNAHRPLHLSRRGMTPYAVHQMLTAGFYIHLGMHNLTNLQSCSTHHDFLG